MAAHRHTAPSAAQSPRFARGCVVSTVLGSPRGFLGVATTSGARGRGEDGSAHRNGQPHRNNSSNRRLRRREMAGRAPEGPAATIIPFNLFPSPGDAGAASCVNLHYGRAMRLTCQASNAPLDHNRRLHRRFAVNCSDGGAASWHWEARAAISSMSRCTPSSAAISLFLGRCQHAPQPCASFCILDQRQPFASASFHDRVGCSMPSSLSSSSSSLPKLLEPNYQRFPFSHQRRAPTPAVTISDRTRNLYYGPHHRQPARCGLTALC